MTAATQPPHTLNVSLQKNMIPINEHKYRIKKLKNFLSVYERFLENPTDDLRNKISMSVGTLSEYIRRSGINTIVNDPERGVVDFIANIFITEITTPQMVKDSVYKAIGNYEFLNTQWQRKMINPIYWVAFIIRLPFIIAEKSGIDITKIEASKTASVYKLSISFIMFLSSLAGLLNYLGISFKLILSVFGFHQ